MLQRFVWVLTAGLLLATTVHAAGPRPDPNPEDRDAREIAEAQQWIEEGKYGRSIRVLNGVLERDRYNADAWSLLGFVYRKQGKLDLSARYYRQALTIDPDHKGALEYQGELFLMQGEPDKARANLERLKALCPDGCEEHTELAEAIAAHEKGEKPVRKSRW